MFDDSLVVTSGELPGIGEGNLFWKNQSVKVDQTTFHKKNYFSCSLSVANRTLSKIQG